jgi:hypothetical protein
LGAKSCRETAESLHFKAGLSKIGSDVETVNAMIFREMRIAKNSFRGCENTSISNPIADNVFNMRKMPLPLVILACLLTRRGTARVALQLALLLLCTKTFSTK